MTLKFDGWPRKTIGHFYHFYATLSFVHHFIAIGKFKLELQPGNAQFGSKLAFFVPCDLEIWWMTLKNNNKAPFLSHIKLCGSFDRHMWIQTVVTARTLLIWVMTICDLDLWPLTLTFCMGINGNHSWKFHDDTMTGTLSKRLTDGRTDGRTDRQTDRRAGGSNHSWRCLAAVKKIIWPK